MRPGPAPRRQHSGFSEHAPQRWKGVPVSGTDAASLRLADLLAALSVTTDLGHGQPPDDAMRACLLATRLAQAMNLPASSISDIYYATLLRYVGCTAYAHEEAALF